MKKLQNVIPRPFLKLACGKLQLIADLEIILPNENKKNIKIKIMTTTKITTRYSVNLVLGNGKYKKIFVNFWVFQIPNSSFNFE